jgi:hypothetical protein
LADGAVDLIRQPFPSKTDDENEESDVGLKATKLDSQPPPAKRKAAAAIIGSSSDDEVVTKPVAKQRKGMFL